VAVGTRDGAGPFDIDTRVARRVLIPLVMCGAFHHALTVRTPMGRRARLKFVQQGPPLIRTSQRDLVAAGVERVPRTTGVRDGRSQPGARPQELFGRWATPRK